MRMGKRCGHESLKQRSRLVGPGLKFRVPLGSDKPGMFRQFAHLHNRSIWREARQAHTGLDEYLAKAVIDFIPVAVAFLDGVTASVNPISQTVWQKRARIVPQTQRSA